MSAINLVRHLDLAVALKRNLASGVVIEVERAPRMNTERSGLAQRCNGSLEHVANGMGLLRSGYGAEDGASGEERRNGCRDSMSRNILDRSETFVIDLLLAASLIERNDFHSEWVVESGGRIIDGKVSVDANTAAHDVDGSGVDFGRIVGCDLVRVVASLD